MWNVIYSCCKTNCYEPSLTIYGCSASAAQYLRESSTLKDRSEPRVSASKFVEEAVYAFSTLFPHHAKSYVPLFEPREHGRLREVLLIEGHEFSDVTLCKV